MPRQFPAYTLNNDGYLVRAMFPKFIAKVPTAQKTNDIEILEWWDDVDDKKKEQIMHHAKKWLIFHQ
jgi:hypothetical protein